MRLRHRRWMWAMLPTALMSASLVLAQEGPEQLEQIEPANGEWQAEYYGSFGGAGDQSVELLAGVSDELVLGVEVEFEGPRGGLRFDTISPVLLYRAVDPDDHAVGLGVELQTAIGRNGSFKGGEARFIVEGARTNGGFRVT